MTTLNNLGRKLLEYRQIKKITLAELAKALDVNPTYLSKLENGHKKPSPGLLIRISNYFLLSKSEALQLFTFAEYKGRDLIIRKEDTVNMDDVVRTNVQPENKKIQVNMPNIPVLYTDSTFVTTSNFGLVLDFAQNVGSIDQQNIVARVGMSLQHAEALLEVLQKKIEEQKNK